MELSEYQVAYWMVCHLTSTIRSPGTCKVAYWSSPSTYQVALLSQTRSPGTCPMAYGAVRDWENQIRSPGTCPMACGLLSQTCSPGT